jgi:hypothetical protein
MMMGKVIDLVGKTFERLTVLERAANAPRSREMWLCRCECGAVITVRGDSLKSKHGRSCGCLRGDVARERSTTHGCSRHGQESAAYRAWRSMRERCSNQRHKQYAGYGGRGIKVCERWNSFENFLEDMGDKPKGLSLDRKDNSKGYEPGNCRWTTSKEQTRNRRSNRIIEFNGETRCLAAWSEVLGFPRTMLGGRLSRGWSVSEALATPAGGKRKAS